MTDSWPDSEVTLTHFHALLVLPGFEKVMAFLGAFLAFSTCVFGPLIASEYHTHRSTVGDALLTTFYDFFCSTDLKLFHTQKSRTRIALDLFILSISAVAAATGTA